MIGPLSPLRTGATGGVGAVRLGGPGGTRTRAGAAMAGIAGQVASSLAREFDLLDDRQQRRHYQPEQDLYEVRATARRLTTDLGGTPAQEGQIARSLGAFVLESASLIAARPEARSLESIAAAIRRGEDDVNLPDSPDQALRVIDATTALVAGSGR